MNYEFNKNELFTHLGLPGTYCSGYGLSEPTGNCTPGYYCPAGQNVSSPQDKQCESGHFCPEGSKDHYPCEPKYYQPSPSKPTCLLCPSGYYCNPADKNRSRINEGVKEPTICPIGYYCPNGTDSYKNYPCKKGYFGNETKLSSHQQCHPCTPAYYCDRDAMIKPNGYCSVGYYCAEKSITATPNNASEGGGPCLEGYYCESGFSQPLPCPKGTYGPRERIGSIGECSDCDGGKYCATPGIPAPNGSCLAGYYCKNKATTPNPISEIYGDECHAGYYCPTGTTTPFPCPPGTFNNQTRGTRPQDCLPCNAGYYCEGYANKVPDGSCEPGYYCTRAAYTSTPISYTTLTSQ